MDSLLIPVLASWWLWAQAQVPEPPTAPSPAGSHTFNIGPFEIGSAEIVSLVIGIVTTVLGALAYDRWKSANEGLRVRRITRARDSDTDAFVSLYDRIIPDGQRVSSEEIVRWIDEDRAMRSVPTHTYLHYLFVAKTGSDVVGFLKAMYCRESRLAFIAYLGIDRDSPQARVRGTSHLLQAFSDALEKEAPDCCAVVFEVEDPGKGLVDGEQSRRVARIRRFKDSARRVSRRAFEIDIEYFQPYMEIPPDDAPPEDRMVLLYIPVRESLTAAKTLPRSTVINLLQFVYQRIYRPTFRHDPGSDLRYQQYLSHLLARSTVGLSEEVRLVD